MTLIFKALAWLDNHVVGHRWYGLCEFVALHKRAPVARFDETPFDGATWGA